MVDAVAPVAPVALVDPSVMVEVTEPLRVVSVAVLLVAVAVVAAAAPVLEQTTALGRSVTPPRAQICLAAWRVAAVQGESRSAIGQPGGGWKTYSPAPSGCTCLPRSRQCCSGRYRSCRYRPHQCHSSQELSWLHILSTRSNSSVGSFLKNRRQATTNRAVGQITQALSSGRGQQSGQSQSELNELHGDVRTN